MTDQPKRSRWKPRALIAFVLLFPVWYVLSYGPVLWLLNRDWDISIDGVAAWALVTFYTPIEWLARHWEGFAQFMTWHNSLWLSD